MKLKYLLFPYIQNYVPNIFILGLSEDSKKVKYNYLFFSIIGYNNDGRKFVFEAFKNGASSVLLDTKYINNHGNIIYSFNKPIIFFYNLKKYISYISGKFYGNPTKYINFIGVTGTNGKTTVSYLLSYWLKLINVKSVIFSTIGIGDIDNLKISKNTTLSALEIQKKVNYFKLNKINNIISEISSHGILEYRIRNVHFRSAILTNISHEHLDYHKNFKNYKDSKLSFFENNKIFSSIINIDNKICKNNINKFNNINYITFKKKYITYAKNWIYIKNIFFIKNSTYIFFESNFGNNNMKVNFICYFNIINLFLSLLTLLDLGYSLKDLVEVSKFLQLPPGRMYLNKIHNNKIIIVDYAHTPFSMKNVFKNIKNIYKNRNIWTIFGCGGNRDYKKRIFMGLIAEKYSYKIILTNDNPRNENQIKIIKDITKKINNKNKFLVILNRKKALNYSIKNSNSYDIIIIFGKGHENYQIFKNKKVYYSDIDYVKKLLI